MAKLRVGVIGAGAIAALAHLPHYQAHPDVDLVAVADVDEARAAAMAEKFGVPKAYGSYEAMLAAERLDAVIVATHNVSHARVTLAALEAGCHVLCEKPLATNVEDAEAMVAAARSRGRILMVGMSHRYRAEVDALRRLVQGGSLGKVYYGRARIMRRRGSPTGWFTDRALSGGGPLLDIGVHALDLAWYLMGKPEPASVFGFTYQGIGRFSTHYVRPWAGHMPGGAFDVEDLACALIRFRDGTALSLEVAWAQNGPQDEALKVDLLGTQGGLSLDPLRVYREENGVLVEVSPYLEARWDFYAHEIDHFVRCALSGETPLSPGEEGVAVVRMLTAIYTSAREGKAVAFG